MSKNNLKQKKWTSEKSVKLTLAISWFVAGLLLLCMVAAPFVIPKWFTFEYSSQGSSYLVRYSYSTVVLSAFYICCPAGICCIACIIKLLTNIKNGAVFEDNNIRLLRILSWCCFFVCAVTLAASLFFIPFVTVFASSGLLGLILRVVKNVMAKATEIKNENDLTI